MWLCYSQQSYHLCTRTQNPKVGVYGPLEIRVRLLM